MSFDSLVQDAEKHKWLIIGLGGGVIGLLILMHSSGGSTAPAAPMPVSEDPTAVAGKVAITQANDALRAQQAAAQAAVATTNSTNKVQSQAVAAQLKYGLNTNAVGANVAGDLASTQLQALENTNYTQSTSQAAQEQAYYAEQEQLQSQQDNYGLQYQSAGAQYSLNSQDSGQSFEQEIYNALFHNQENLTAQGYAYQNAALNEQEVLNASNNQAYEYGIGMNANTQNNALSDQATQGYIQDGLSGLSEIGGMFGGFL